MTQPAPSTWSCPMTSDGTCSDPACQRGRACRESLPPVSQRFVRALATAESEDEIREVWSRLKTEVEDMPEGDEKASLRQAFKRHMERVRLNV